VKFRVDHFWYLGLVAQFYKEKMHYDNSSESVHGTVPLALPIGYRPRTGFYYCWFLITVPVHCWQPRPRVINLSITRKAYKAGVHHLSDTLG